MGWVGSLVSFGSLKESGTLIAALLYFVVEAKVDYLLLLLPR